MKFNWGTGLVVFFTVFVSTLVFILYKSRQIENSLVIDNYYDEDIKYQQHFDKVQNTADLPVKVKVDYDSAAKIVVFTFPGNPPMPTNGKIQLYSPISNKSDKNYEFSADEHLMYKIPVDNITPGKWKWKIDWKQDSKMYYQEEEIIIIQ
jgi:nitrogen fixation protein FixH